MVSEAINIYSRMSWMSERETDIFLDNEYMSYISYRNEKLLYSNDSVLHFLDVGYSTIFFIYLVMGSQAKYDNLFMNKSHQ